MGVYKTRTSFINKKINETTDAELKKLLSNGFIPDSLQAEYAAYIAETGEDTDIDKISNANYFALNPEKVGGKIVPGSGFLNPTLTKGNINTAVDAINSTLKTTVKQEPVIPAEPAKPIAKDVKPLKEKPIPIQKMPVPNVDLEPTIEIDGNALQLIVSNHLLEDKPKKEKYTVDETIKLYNRGISDAEIKAWVYHKRKYGNPMKGWEAYFIKGTGASENVLLITTKETTVKDNAYRDLRVIPANVSVGIKTKFKNTYGDENLVICRTEQGELIWINTAHVKEQKGTSGASEQEIDSLVAEKALIYDGNDYYPYPVFLFGNIYEKIDSLNENKDAIIKKYGVEVFDAQVVECEKFKPKLKSFRDPVKTNRRNDFQIFTVKRHNIPADISTEDMDLIFDLIKDNE